MRSSHEMMEAPPRFTRVAVKGSSLCLGGNGWHVAVECQPNEVTHLSHPVLGKMGKILLTALQSLCYFHLSELRMINRSEYRDVVVSLECCNLGNQPNVTVRRSPRSPIATLIR
jgi:hypothetical protein